MTCIKCGGRMMVQRTTTLDDIVYRRRVCEGCGKAIRTYERLDKWDPKPYEGVAMKAAPVVDERQAGLPLVHETEQAEYEPQPDPEDAYARALLNEAHGIEERVEGMLRKGKPAEAVPASFIRCIESAHNEALYVERMRRVCS